MNVKDVMMRTPVFCGPETNAGAAAEIMWNRNCGLLPIVDAEGKVAGVVTDRDLCIALGTRNARAGEISLREITTGRVYFCYPEDDIHDALRTMTHQKVRRLLVLDKDGRLQGILSMDDLVRHATDRSLGKFPELSYADVVAALQIIFEPQLPKAVAAKVAA
jgi:CBS domain-containing protein